MSLAQTQLLCPRGEGHYLTRPVTAQSNHVGYTRKASSSWPEISSLGLLLTLVLPQGWGISMSTQLCPSLYTKNWELGMVAYVWSQGLEIQR